MLAEKPGRVDRHEFHRFANTFREVVGLTPGAYLQAGIGLAQQHLAVDMPQKLVAQDVGYSSELAPSRAF